MSPFYFFAGKNGESCSWPRSEAIAAAKPPDLAQDIGMSWGIMGVSNILIILNDVEWDANKMI